MKFKLLPWLFSFVLLLSVAMGAPSVEAKNTEILWDTYGIPHIYGRDVPGAFRAFGWAQMQSHGNLILRLYGQARGRAAEYWGEKYLESDKWVQTVGIPERAQKWYREQKVDFQENLDSFAAGVNEYARKHPEAIASELKVVLPVRGVDLLAHVQRVLQFTFIADPESVAKLGKDGEMLGKVSQKSYGSNAWAIAPSRSESGNAILLANPHLPWSDLFLWYEAQITAPGIDAYGATLVGVPVLAIAFNDNLGWAHTVNTFDGWDLYALTLADKGYLFDGKVLPFAEEVKTIKVREGNGKVRSQELNIRRSLHGAIVGEKDGKPLALRVVGLDRPGVLQQWWDMARANNLAEFETVLDRLQLPMFTIMYADKKGHVMHLFNGQVPVRNGGDFESWQEIIAGDTSDALWTKYHPYQDLPRAIDPPSGWLQNTNDPPWTTTLPQVINSQDYPAYMAPQETMHFRAQRSAKILSGDPKISLKEAIRYKYDTRMELGDRLAGDLVAAAQKQDNPLVRRAAKVLKKWDRQTNASSRGAVLFAAWVEEMDFPEDFAISGSDRAPLTTPDGLKNSQKAISALSQAALKVERSYGSLDVPWGEVFRLRYGKVDLPANGGGSELGIFPVIDFAPAPGNKFQSVGGDSYIAAIEFSNPVKAMVLTAYGNSSQPNSPHMGDGLQLFARQQLHPAWRSRREILAHLEQRQRFY